VIAFDSGTITMSTSERLFKQNFLKIDRIRTTLKIKIKPRIITLRLGLKLGKI
jgi:hypothetical protein